MKAITIKQPYAQLICEGVKDIENRTWKTNYRGRVLIHAGADKKLNLNALTSEQYDFAADKLDASNRTPTKAVNEWSRSAIIGSVEIVDCVRNHDSIWAEKTQMKRSIGIDEFVLIPKEKPIYNWVLANPILFEEPILNVKGKLSFWDYPMSEEEYLNLEYTRALQAENT